MKLAGNTFIPDGDSYFANYFKGSDVFEQENLDLALSFVKNFDVAIDGGAHVGSWTRYLSSRFNLVAAYEPNPVNFECLVLNTMDCKNVVLSKFGLSDQDESGALADGNNSGCWHVVEGKDIRLRKLDDYGGLDFLKLDVEGYEDKALNGAFNLLIKYRPVVIIEEKDLPHKPCDYKARKMLESIRYQEAARSGRDVIFTYTKAKYG
jgi:FkbM family methyltransferase